VWSGRSRPLLLALSCRAQRRTERGEVHCAVKASLPPRVVFIFAFSTTGGRPRVHSCRLGIVRLRRLHATEGENDPDARCPISRAAFARSF